MEYTFNFFLSEEDWENGIIAETRSWFEATSYTAFNAAWAFCDIAGYTFDWA